MAVKQQDMIGKVRTFQSGETGRVGEYYKDADGEIFVRGTGAPAMTVSPGTKKAVSKSTFVEAAGMPKVSTINNVLPAKEVKENFD